MKKLLALCLAMLLTLSLFVGAYADEKVTLTFAETMTSPERTLVLEDAIKAYEADHPNVTIELVSPPYESAETKVASMLAAGQEVDIVEIRDNSVGAWINNGFLYKLDDLVADWDGKDQLVDAALLAGASMGDATFFIPQYLYVKALMVRTDILDKLGVTEMPTTTDEFLAVCKQITDPSKGQYAFALRGIGSPCKTTDIMFATEVPNLRLDNFYLTEDGTFYMDTDGGRKALANYLDLFQNCCPPDSVNWGYNDQINGFVSGTTPFLVQDPDAVGSVSGSLSPDQYTAIPMPLGDSGTRYLDYGFAGLAVAANSEHPAEAFDFVKYMISAEVNASICEFYGALPVNKGAYEASAMFELPVYKAWADEMADEHTVFTKFPLEDPRFTEYASTVHLAAIQSYLLGQSTAEDMIKTCKDFWGY
ncbi:MAG: sugar ABC transporter substrate-binding protein [Oscillospiraceae bacterium]|nr:sugar ABC transporter substrate-binding protein [Oscillospiraceae bacterium]